ncbi:MAG: hypothetical protein L0215_24535 [Gemmataceae bacterium]|nr:hypothetical protein [Gemmataceae bacterium]
MLIWTLVVGFLTLILVAFMWLFGDLSFRAKLILTLLYVASFGFLFWRDYNFLAIVSQCFLAVCIGGAVFGVEFLTRRH